MSIISNIVGRLHVSATDIEVIRAVRLSIAPAALSRRHRKARHAIYRQALAEHAKNFKFYRFVMTGGRP